MSVKNREDKYHDLFEKGLRSGLQFVTFEERNGVSFATNRNPGVGIIKAWGKRRERLEVEGEVEEELRKEEFVS